MMNWFVADKDGLAAQARERGIGRLIGELIRNSLDESGVTTVAVTLAPVPNSPKAAVCVTDDAPGGFRDRRDAYTLFAKSYKRENPEQAGQFNCGEKHFVAVCDEAAIETTTGSLLFDSTGRHELRRKTERGSVIRGTLRITRDELAEVDTYLRSLILAQNGVAISYQGEPLRRREPVKVVKAKLPTPMPDDHGVMRSRERETTIEIHEPLAGEVASIYELGMPVVETGDRWHVVVHQKVPLNKDRDNVPPSFLRRLRTVVLDAMRDELRPEDGRSLWVKQALPQAEPESVKAVIEKAFGKKNVISDPSCPEATKRAFDEGYSVIAPGTFGRDEWAAIKRAEASQPAGRIQSLRGDIASSPDGIPPVPPSQWKREWAAVAEYTKRLALELTGRCVTVLIYRIPHGQRWGGCCGKVRGEISFNGGQLSRDWWTDQEAVDQLLIHEFAHFAVSDHLSDGFHRECCRLGAKLRTCAAKLKTHPATGQLRWQLSPVSHPIL